MSTKAPIQRRFDQRNLVRELAENRTDALEIVREALSNAKDHEARSFWLRTSRDARNRVDIMIFDDGEGLTEDRLAAFWGVGASSKKNGRSHIGYKGHGTKLYFDCDRLSCATNHDGARWWLTELADPANSEASEVPVTALPSDHPLAKELASLDIVRGTAIRLEGVRFVDTARLLSRLALESYCDWFTFIGDVRAGLYDERKDWHDAIADGATAGLLGEQVSLHPMTVHLCINGETSYTSLGFGKRGSHDNFFAAWQDDVKAHAKNPGLLAFGHRFANAHISHVGAARVRDDLSAIRLTDLTNWSDPTSGLSIVARVEGHRRQRETYREAAWQNHQGVYGFEARFGLWLCRDFIPIVRRNELLEEAIDRASKHKLRYELGSKRNWQVFVNHQGFLPTANRGGISNESLFTEAVISQLAAMLERAFKSDDFRDWVDRLRGATLAKKRADEAAYMDERRQLVQSWYAASKRPDEIEITEAGKVLDAFDDTDSLVIRQPTSEQEVFYVYALLAGRYKLPIQILEYDAQEGVDAIALLREKALVPHVSGTTPFVRLELKNIVSANTPLQHFFEAIDCVLCWKVNLTGDLFERGSQGDVGRIRKRAKPMLDPALDTYEIEHDHKGSKRVIPVLELSVLWPKVKRSRSK
ncbi:MAG: sensor histidine kinase [Deltaproteobacteria bacterium]|nr:sensor histidine kinase [Deltaproteobacteria bacterium]